MKLIKNYLDNSKARLRLNIILAKDYVFENLFPKFNDFFIKRVKAQDTYSSIFLLNFLLAYVTPVPLDFAVISNEISKHKSVYQTVAGLFVPTMQNVKSGLQALQTRYEQPWVQLQP